jgi:hypothetical protein
VSGWERNIPARRSGSGRVVVGASFLNKSPTFLSASLVENITANITIMTIIKSAQGTDQ